MKKKMIYVLILIAFILISGYQLEAASEEEMLDHLSELEGLEYDLRNREHAFEESKGEEFTESFYQEFLEGNVKFIEPKYSTDNMADAELLGMLDHYPDFCFRISSKSPIATGTVPHYNFKVYRGDFTNDENKNLIVYGGGYGNSENLDTKERGRYSILEWHNEREKRETLDSKTVRSEYKGEDKERTGHFNGIIKYKNIYYIYEIGVRDTRTRIIFHRWNNESKGVSARFIYTISH